MELDRHILVSQRGWHESHAWLPLAVVDIVRDRVPVLAPDATIKFESSGEPFTGKELFDDENEPIIRIEIYRGDNVFRPSFAVAVRSRPPTVVLGPLSPVITYSPFRCRSLRWYWHQESNGHDHAILINEFRHEFERWLKGDIKVMYVSHGRRLIGLQVCSQSGVEYAEWGKSFARLRKLSIICNRHFNMFDANE